MRWGNEVIMAPLFPVALGSLARAAEIPPPRKQSTTLRFRAVFGYHMKPPRKEWLITPRLDNLMPTACFSCCR